MSKTAKTLNARQKIMNSICAYANCAQDWDPKAEGDYTDLVDDVDEHLEEFARKLCEHSYE